MLFRIIIRNISKDLLQGPFHLPVGQP